MQTNAYITAYTTIEDDAFLGPCSVTTNDIYMRVGAELKGAVVKKGHDRGKRNHDVCLPATEGYQCPGEAREKKHAYESQYRFEDE